MNGTVIASSRNPWPSKTPETRKIDYQSRATSLSRDVTPDGKGLLISRPWEKRESSCARDVFLAPSKVELLDLLGLPARVDLSEMEPTNHQTIVAWLHASIT